MAEADQADGQWRGQLELVALLDLRGEPLGERDAGADVGAQALGAVVADDEPELEGAEAPAERDVPVAVVHDLAGVGGAVAQLLGTTLRAPIRAARSATQKPLQSKLVSSHLCGLKV